jgi:hypothetical protein
MAQRKAFSHRPALSEALHAFFLPRPAKTCMSRPPCPPAAGRALAGVPAESKGAGWAPVHSQVAQGGGKKGEARGCERQSPARARLKLAMDNASTSASAGQR